MGTTAKQEEAAACSPTCQILIARQRDRIDVLDKQVTTLVGQVKTLMDQVKGLDAHVKTIDGKIPTRVVLGAEQMIQYQKMQVGYSFNQKCPDGTVAIGWGHGTLTTTLGSSAN